MKDGNIVVFTGGFDPIHSGHIQALKEAQQLGRVVIGLNSDEWLARKKGRPFMPFAERKAVLEQLKGILQVIGFDDADGTACDAIEQILQAFPNDSLVFVNGGDRNQGTTPEIERFKNHPRVSFVFGVGGQHKQNSSSWLLSDWKSPSEQRIWGKFFTHYDSPKAKVKRLVLDPGKSISMQFHNSRAELWFVEAGEGTAYSIDAAGEYVRHPLSLHDVYTVSRKEWHKLENTGTEPLCIIEIQYGDVCIESDIVRKTP